MRLTNKLSVIGLFVVVCVTHGFSKTINSTYVKGKDTSTSSGTQRYWKGKSLSFKEVIPISSDINEKLSLEVTKRGNGIATIGGVQLYVWNSSNGLNAYNNEMLDIDFVDINQDGLKEMILSGIVSYYGEQSEEAKEREGVVFIFSYDIKSQTFKESFRKASFDVTQSNGENEWMSRM